MNKDCFQCIHYSVCVEQLPICEFTDMRKVIFLDFSVGDMVYACTCTYRAPVNEGEITAWVIVSYTASCNKKGEYKLRYRACEFRNGKTSGNQFDFSPEDIGRKVFLTKSAAIKVFKENFR